MLYGLKLPDSKHRYIGTEVYCIGSLDKVDQIVENRRVVIAGIYSIGIEDSLVSTTFL